MFSFLRGPLRGLGQMAAQVAPGPRQQAFQGFDADMHQRRGLGVGQFLVVLQDDRLALAVRQLCQRLGHALALGLGFELVDGCRGAIRDLDGMLGVDAQVLFAPPQTVVAQVQRDPMQPGIEARLLAAPARRLFPDPQETLLGDVPGLVGIPSRRLARASKRGSLQ